MTASFPAGGCVDVVQSRVEGVVHDISVEHGELVIETCDIEYTRRTSYFLWERSTRKKIARPGCGTRTEPLLPPDGAEKPERGR
jgi:hypothetical protein